MLTRTDLKVGLFAIANLPNFGPVDDDPVLALAIPPPGSFSLDPKRAIV
ncbi:MAG TPA: hypothetical protein VEI83_13615 [Acidimicrobiales bacterium]|nr:hypothetical protein [Acidimicrobiales bacterium]